MLLSSKKRPKPRAVAFALAGALVLGGAAWAQYRDDVVFHYLIPPERPAKVIPQPNIRPAGSGKGIVIGTSNAIAGPSSPESNWFVVTADPQYPWTPNMDDADVPKAADEHAYSRQLIEEQYDSINRFSQDKEAWAVFVNGDLTAFGHESEVEYMKGALKRLRLPVYLGLGNHDYQNNANDCYFNNCMIRSVYWFLEHMGQHGLLALDSHKRRYYEFPNNTEEVYGSFGWVQEWPSNFTVIQLNNNPEYSAWVQGFSGSRSMNEVINVQPSVRWLDHQLSRARKLGRNIIVMMHKPEGIHEISDLLNRYAVTAVFAGHLHKGKGCYPGYGNYEGLFCFSGSASQRSYLVMEDVDGAARELRVYQVKENNPEAMTFAGSIPLENRVDWIDPKPYPFKVRVQNQGGFEAGFWASYKIGSASHSFEAYRQIGSGYEFTFPAGAHSVRLHAAAYTGMVWNKWDDIFYERLNVTRDYCFVVWGTTLHNYSNHC